MVLRVPYGPLAPRVARAFGRVPPAFRRGAAGGGGGGGGSNELNFTGPQSFTAGSAEVAETLQLGSRPFTLTLDYISTDDSSTQNLFSIWNSPSLSIRVRALNSNTLQILGSNFGFNSNSLFSFSNSIPANNRYEVVIERVGNTLNIAVDGSELGTANVNGYFYDGNAPAVIGGNFTGTFYAASLVFND